MRPGRAITSIPITGFQSTHSLRSATAISFPALRRKMVSIHALLAECDRGGRRTFPRLLCFNPRTPCGVRQGIKTMSNQINLFQSTHSLRSATNKTIERNKTMNVSIHALLAECDSVEALTCGELGTVSIHALLAECDPQQCRRH